MTDRVWLEPVEAAEVTIIADNSIDLWLTTERAAQRARRCTGWRVTHELAGQLPQAYLQTSVGARLPFA
jgi:hypothetical protein